MPETVEQTADATTALNEASDAALASNDYTRYAAIENSRELAERAGKPTPEAPALPTPSETPAASEAATKPAVVEKKAAPKTGEDRKAELRAEIQALLDERAKLQGKIPAAAPGEKPADPPPAAVVAPPAAKPAEPGKRPVKPDPKDFSTMGALREADAQYAEDNAKYYALEAVQTDRATREVASQNQVIQTALQARQAEARAMFPDDFDAVALNPKTPLTKAMDGWILKNSKLEGGLGMHVLYRLGQNDSAEALRIGQLDAYDQAEELNKIRDSFTGKTAAAAAAATPAKRQTTTAPSPATDLGSRTAEPGDPIMAALARGDMETYTRLQNAAEIKERRGR